MGWRQQLGLHSASNRCVPTYMYTFLCWIYTGGENLIIKGLRQTYSCLEVIFCCSCLLPVFGLITSGKRGGHLRTEHNLAPYVCCDTETKQPKSWSQTERPGWSHRAAHFSLTLINLGDWMSQRLRGSFSSLLLLSLAIPREIGRDGGSF